jgi:raffinose/stachyose/melibiose transport system permease protein
MKKLINNKYFVITSLLLPGIVLYGFAIFLPIAISLFSSLTNMTSMNYGTAKTVGFLNYWNIFFNDKTFWVSTMHAVILGLCYALIQHPIAILSALLLDKIGGKREKVLRTIYFLPAVISVVVTTMMWKNIVNQQFGLFNKILSSIGLGAFQHDWLGDPNTAFPTILFIILWQGFGMGFLLYYSGIKGIPAELYEAAKIDGASGLKLYTKITIPLLSPIIRVAVTLGMVNALKQMEVIYISTSGGPGDRTEFLANYLYRIAFQNMQFGYANALSITFVVLCLLTAFIFNKLLQKDIGEI